MRRVVVTGASRGLGLEFVRQLIDRGDEVAATCRRPDQAEELGQLIEANSDQAFVVQLDASDPGSVERAASVITDRFDTVDLLVNNGAMGHDPGFDEAASSGPLASLGADAMTAVLRTNVVGPAIVTQAFAGALARAGQATVVNLTSGLGSLEGTNGSSSITYSMSKAALNMLTRKLAAELREQRTTVVSISPGWVHTDMGGPSAPLTPEQSIRDMLSVVDGLHPDDTGRFLDHSGSQIPW